MNRHPPFAEIIARRSPSAFTRIREIVIALAVVALPALAILAMAYQVRIVQVVSGDAVTVSGRTAAGNRISLTTYAAPDLVPPR